MTCVPRELDPPRRTVREGTEISVIDGDRVGQVLARTLVPSRLGHIALQGSFHLLSCCCPACSCAIAGSSLKLVHLQSRCCTVQTLVRLRFNLVPFHCHCTLGFPARHLLSFQGFQVPRFQGCPRPSNSPPVALAARQSRLETAHWTPPGPAIADSVAAHDTCDCGRHYCFSTRHSQHTYKLLFTCCPRKRDHAAR